MSIPTITEDAKTILRLLLHSPEPLGHLDIGWQQHRFDAAIAEIRAAGVDLKDDLGSH
jgi:hypothetical protein